MMKHPRAILSMIVALVFAAAPAALRARQESHQEHDHEHAAGELGAVHFPISCAPAAQADFDRGLALLHSFGYELARDAFAAATQRDAHCGIAWWGVAMTYYHPLWAPPTPEELGPGREAAERATAIGGGNERESGFIEAIAAFYADAAWVAHGERVNAYRAKLEALTQRFPEDAEARIFYALALLGSAPVNDASLAQQRRAAEILNAELERQPKHPGVVHYLIHAFDYPNLAELALPAARAYAAIAPASPHAQHMPSHIFTRLGLWKESIESNLDSEASANAIAAKRKPGTVSHDALHALDYLEYAYLQTDRVKEAKDVLDRAARAVSFDTPVFQAGYALAAIPARYLLERRAWKEAAKLEPPLAKLPWERFNYAMGTIHFARAIGGARSGDAAIARAAVDELKRIQTGLASQAGPYDWAGQVESMRLAAAGWLAQAEGRSDEAIGLLRQAAELQDKVGKHPVTPGEVLPARELLADLLAELGRPREALVEYEATLVANPGRLNALRGAAAAAEQAGQGAKAREIKAAIAKQVGES